MDIGYGDAVTPAAQSITYPVLIEGFPAPLLRAYPMATVVAEKFQAICALGLANTRMKDYFDLWALLQRHDLAKDELTSAIVATFTRRGTALPEGWPIGISDAFADAGKQGQWRAFLSKASVTAPALLEVLDELRLGLTQPLRIAREHSA